MIWERAQAAGSRAALPVYCDVALRASTATSLASLLRRASAAATFPAPPPASALPSAAPLLLLLLLLRRRRRRRLLLLLLRRRLGRRRDRSCRRRSRRSPPRLRRARLCALGLPCLGMVTSLPAMSRLGLRWRRVALRRCGLSGEALGLPRLELVRRLPLGLTRPVRRHLADSAGLVAPVLVVLVVLVALVRRDIGLVLVLVVLLKDRVFQQILQQRRDGLRWRRRGGGRRRRRGSSRRRLLV